MRPFGCGSLNHCSWLASTRQYCVRLMARILVTGATGYIGGRLVPRLLEAGHEVRCMTRVPSRLDLDPWRNQVEVVTGNVLDLESLKAALQGCDFAFYFVHSLGDAADFEAADRAGAENFRIAADANALQRIIYLGGLGEDESELSAHLESRHEVGKVLASGSTPVTEIRAAVIIGSGSVSFEMLRYLTEVLPAMTTPKWVRSMCQPIAIRDVLTILVAVLERHHPGSEVIEVGGPDVLSYQDMMQTYAEVAGLRKRLIVPVPVLSPGLSSLWIGLVTPLPSGVARPLVDSLKHDVVVRDGQAQSELLDHPLSFREAVRLALARYENGEVVTRWSDAEASPALPIPSDPDWAGGSVLIDEQGVVTSAPPEDVFWAVSRIGGTVGYYVFDWAWAVRGWFDTLIGGIGLRRGRRHPEVLHEGESLDFWRVSVVDPPHRLLLRAEMKVPGEAFLEWVITPDGDETAIKQTAYFAPRGLFGRLYWFALVPIHAAIFGPMARRIADSAVTHGRDRQIGDST